MGGAEVPVAMSSCHWGVFFFLTEAGHGYLSHFVQGERSRASQLSLLAGLDGTRSSGAFEGFGVMWTVAIGAARDSGPEVRDSGAFSQCAFNPLRMAPCAPTAWQRPQWE